MTDDPLEQYLAAKSAPAGGTGADPLVAYLDSKQGDRRAQLETRHKQNVKDLRQLRADPETRENTLGDYAQAAGGAVWDRVKGIGSGVAEIAAHPIATFADDARRRELERGVDDAVTLGYGQKAADFLARKLGGQTMGETAAADAQAAPGVRTGGNVVGAFLPGVTNAIGRGAGAVASKAVPVAGAVGGAGRAALGYELAAPAISGLGAGASGHRLEAAADAATDPANLLIAAGAGAAGGAIANAPARAEASELKGLTEGVQNKTRVGKYVPDQADIQKQLATVPDVRALIKQDPVKAQPIVAETVAARADATLEPFYRQMAATGQDQIPIDTVTQGLKAVRAGFNRVTEKAQIAAVDDYISGFEAEAAQNGGKLPAQFVRESATSLQGQGFANVPMFGQVPLSKAMKQGMGNALRGAVADHLESLTPNDAAGKALRDAFTSANREVATWYRIKDIVDEKASRIQGNAQPAADILHTVHGAIHHPIRAALGVLPEAADVVDRRILGPAMRSAPGQALAGGVGAAPVMAGQNPVMAAYEAEKERQRRRAELARGAQP